MAWSGPLIARRDPPQKIGHFLLTCCRLSGIKKKRGGRPVPGWRPDSLVSIGSCLGLSLLDLRDAFMPAVLIVQAGHRDLVALF